MNDLLIITTKTRYTQIDNMFLAVVFALHSRQTNMRKSLYIASKKPQKLFIWLKEYDNDQRYQQEKEMRLA